MFEQTVNETMFSSKQLTPEQNKAIAIANRFLPINPCDVLCQIPDLIDICQTGAMHLVKGHVSTSQLPRGPRWLWNQSRARKTVTDPSGMYQIIFHKLNTRRCKKETSDTPVPQFKLWVYQLTSKYEKISIIWCERGQRSSDNFFQYCAPSKSKLPKMRSTTIEELCVDDFQFLRPFVSDAVAISLGWEAPTINFTNIDYFR